MKIIDAKLQVVEVPLPHPFPSTWNPGNPETKLFVTIAEIITDDGIHGYGAACDSSQLLAGIWDTHIRPLVIGNAHYRPERTARVCPRVRRRPPWAERRLRA